jgi:hypothetical protein
LWLLAFIGFSLLHAGWAFAAPYDGPPDEQQHALRASGLMHGGILSGDDYRLDVARSLDKNNTDFGQPSGALVNVHTNCFPMQVHIAANCAEEPGGDESTHSQFVSAARYNPVYYAVTSWPLLPWPNWRGIMLSRLLTGMLVAAFLACAVVGAARWTRHRSVLAGLVVAITPMTAHLAGSINPNGLEIAAGVSLFVALIAILQEKQESLNRAAVALACISAGALVTPRFLGAMWLAIILVAVLIPSRMGRIKQLVRSRSVRLWSLVAIVATLASVGWTRLVSGVGVPAFRETDPFKENIKVAVLEIWPNVVNQMVAVTGWSEVLMPRLIYVAWFMAAGLLILGGFAMGGRRDRLGLLALLIGSFVPLLAAELLMVGQIGWFNQGRYFLAGAVGLPMIGAYVMANRGITAEQMRSITRMLAVLLIPIHLVCLAYTMMRWQSGLKVLNPLKGSWLPHYGAVLPLVLGVLGCAVLFGVYWVASRIPAELPPAEPTEDEASSTPELQTASV